MLFFPEIPRELGFLKRQTSSASNSQDHFEEVIVVQSAVNSSGSVDRSVTSLLYQFNVCDLFQRIL